MTAGRFAGLALRLGQAGISPRRVRRLVSELDAHFEDLVAEFQSTGLSRSESESQADVRLGTEDALVESMMQRPELRSWPRRWPWLAFAVLPVLALLVQFVLSIAVGVAVVNFSVHILGLTALHPGPVPWICGVFQAYALWIAPMLAAAGACYFAVRYRASAFWPAVGGILIAFLGATTNASFQWSLARPRGVISAGIGIPGQGPAAAFRVLLTLTVMLALFLWPKRGMLRHR